MYPPCLILISRTFNGESSWKLLFSNTSLFLIVQLYCITHWETLPKSHRVFYSWEYVRNTAVTLWSCKPFNRLTSISLFLATTLRNVYRMLGRSQRIWLVDNGHLDRVDVLSSYVLSIYELLDLFCSLLLIKVYTHF